MGDIEKNNRGSNTTYEGFLEKLATCIERGDLDACVEVATRLAKEMGIEAKELLELSGAMGQNEELKLA